MTPCRYPFHRDSAISARFAVIIWMAIGGLALAAADGGPTNFKITTRRPDDAVEVRVEKEKAIFIVSSPSGIGGASIERTGEKWPGVVILRLKLKGLEHFQATAGKVTLGAAVTSGEHPPAARVWKDGKEDAPLDDQSPFWIDVRSLNADGTPAAKLPLDSGHFELQLPRALLQGEPQSIRLEWIDFYRT